MQKEHSSQKHREKPEEKHRQHYLDANGKPIQFSLWCNHRLYKIPVNSMIRVSKRCLSLAKSNDFQGSIVHPVSEDALTAFLLACELKPFKVTASNALELLELSQEWEIRSLNEFVTAYISKKGVKQSNDIDHLGRLLSVLKKEEADSCNEIRNVARNFNEYLLDDRLARIHPEHLFRILSQAELRPIDQQRLTDFIMSLFESDPEKAVPLSLKVNFELLDKDQLEKVFQTREFHEQSIAYFASKALTDFRHKFSNMLTSIDSKYFRNLQAIRDHIIKRRTIKLANLEVVFDQQVRELQKVIAVQQKQINKLKNVRDERRKAMSIVLNNYKTKKEKLDKEFQKIDAIVNEVHGTQNDRFSVIKGQIDERVAPITKFVVQNLTSLVSKNFHRRDLMKKGLEERRSRLVQFCEDVAANVSSTSLSIQNLQDRVTETRAAFASKILKDQLRKDSFIRNTQNQFAIFDVEPRFWELTSDQVKLAQEIVDKMESKVRIISKRRTNQQNNSDGNRSPKSEKI